jgi:hypothetical protein
MSSSHPDPSRILSIQSHVVSGYVGACRARRRQDMTLKPDHSDIPLVLTPNREPRSHLPAPAIRLRRGRYQHRTFQQPHRLVVSFPCVGFSDPTTRPVSIGYGHTNGHKTSPEQLEAVFAGLQTNGLHGWGRLLTGEPTEPRCQVIVRHTDKGFS